MPHPTDYPIDTMFRRIGAFVARFPKAAMFELRDRGYDTLFEQLVSCIISIRTLDETTIPVSERLFAVARRPAEMLQTGREALIDLLDGTTFPGQKAATILEAAALAEHRYDGDLPADFAVLTGIRGVGPKCANLTLGVAGGQAAVSVDSHVHRVVNRWGLVATAAPEKTMKALDTLVDRAHWTDINRLLMPFGKFHCTWRLPHCSVCPVAEWCLRVGVTKHR